jgi:hypothetical protein
MNKEFTWGTVIPREMFLPIKEGDDFDRWTGTERAMLTKHSDKFSKEACKDDYKGDKLCPYAISASMEKKGYTPHYKKQATSKEGTPQKKEKYKKEDNKNCKCENTLWERWVQLKEENMSCHCNCEACKGNDCSKCTCADCKCEGCECC